MDKELIDMMRECDLIAGNADHGIFIMALKKFAGMVEAKAKTEEREACEKICNEELQMRLENANLSPEKTIEREKWLSGARAAKSCLSQIRARGEA